MAKRFHDSNKWDDPWYLDLSNEHKLAWDYITSKCDGVGVWKPSLRLLTFNMGITDIEGFLSICGGRIFVMENGNWWIVKFCDFQYGTLNEEACFGQKTDGTRYVKNKPHLSYINLLKKHSLWIVYTKGIHTLKEKEKDKEKEIDKEKEKEKEDRDRKKFDLVFPYDSLDFLQAWKVLAESKNWKKKEPTALQASLKKLSKVCEQDAIKMIENCIAGGWMGLVELKENEKHGYSTKQQLSAGGAKSSVRSLVDELRKSDQGNNSFDSTGSD